MSSVLGKDLTEYIAACRGKACDVIAVENQLLKLDPEQLPGLRSIR